MKPYERRAADAYPYFKLAVWNPTTLTFVDGRRAFSAEADARRDACNPGRYRISRVDESGRVDLEPFII